MNLLQLLIWIVIISSSIIVYKIWKSKHLILDTKPDWKVKGLEKLKELEGNKKLEGKYRILELDKIMEFILQSKFDSTKSFGEILKENEKSFDPSPRHQIWVAHKLRNKIVHDMQYEGAKNEFENIIKKYTANIRDLLV